MAAVTDISICSNALLMLGDSPISSFTEGENPTAIRRAQVMGNLWPQVRDMVLRAKTWNCCKKRAMLAALADAPKWGYKAQFKKPADWLRTVQVGYDSEAWPYRDEGGVILCDASALPLLYVFRNENPATYDTMLQDVLSLAMASRICYAITKSAAQQKNQIDLLKDAWMRASAVDGQDDGPEDAGGFDMLAARLGASW